MCRAQWGVTVGCRVSLRVMLGGTTDRDADAIERVSLGVTLGGTPDRDADAVELKVGVTEILVLVDIDALELGTNTIGFVEKGRNFTLTTGTLLLSN